MNEARAWPRLFALTAVTLSAFVDGPAAAQDASPWTIDIRSASRLVVATAPRGAAEYRAGVELRLDPGWHTYWRYPGDSGVPPRIDFTESDNVRTATVLYPAPHPFSDETGTMIGYNEHVLYPVIVTPRNPAKPVRLKLNLEYAVCEKLCVPSSGHADLTLSDRPSGFDAAIASWEARVPKPVSPQDAGLTARRVAGGSKPAVAVDIARGDAVELLAEGPTSEWALPVPKAMPNAPQGHRLFTFDLDGLPPGTDPNKPLDLTFTIIGADRAFETKTHLD